MDNLCLECHYFHYIFVAKIEILVSKLITILFLSVDTADSGYAVEIDFSVIDTYGSRLVTRRQQLSAFSQSFSFVPVTTGSHCIKAAINKDNIMGINPQIKIKY